jgi:hypothetical protein
MEALGQVDELVTKMWSHSRQGTRCPHEPAGTPSGLLRRGAHLGLSKPSDHE